MDHNALNIRIPELSALYFMYVGESSAEQRMERSRYFTVSGVVVYEDHAVDLERSACVNSLETTSILC